MADEWMSVTPLRGLRGQRLGTTTQLAGAAGTAATWQATRRARALETPALKVQTDNNARAATDLGMQFGEEPSISHVANRFMGTGLLRAPLPGKLSLPLLSAMVRPGCGWDRPAASWGSEGGL